MTDTTLPELMPWLVLFSLIALALAGLCWICDWLDKRSRRRDTERAQRTLVDLKDWEARRRRTGHTAPRYPTSDGRNPDER